MFKSMWWSHIPNIDLVPVIAGAENEPPGTPPPGAGGGTGPNDQAGGAGQGQQQQEEERDPQKKIAALIEEKDRHWTAAQTAEQKLADAATELEELRKFREEKEQENLSEKDKVNKQIENLQTELDQTKKTLTDLQEASKKLVVKNAFLAANDVKWHNAESALALADLSEIEIVDGKDGLPALKDPTAMKNAIEALSKSHPYLVNNSEGAPPTWTGKTGDKQQRQQTGNEATRTEDLRKRYPALRR